MLNLVRTFIETDELCEDAEGEHKLGVIAYQYALEALRLAKPNAFCPVDPNWDYDMKDSADAERLAVENAIKVGKQLGYKAARLMKETGTLKRRAQVDPAASARLSQLENHQSPIASFWLACLEISCKALNPPSMGNDTNPEKKIVLHSRIVKCSANALAALPFVEHFRAVIQEPSNSVIGINPVSLLLERYKALGAPLAHEDYDTESARRDVVGALTWILGTYNGVASTLSLMCAQLHLELQMSPLVVMLGIYDGLD